MPKDNGNVKFWESVKGTDPAKTRKVKLGGREFTAIDPYYQIYNATEKFGMYGKKWGVRNERYYVLYDSLVMYQAEMWYIDGEQESVLPIHSSANALFGKKEPSLDGDIAKKLATDALTKGLSKLGFNADVFMGLYDDNKYVEKMRMEYAAQGIYWNKKLYKLLKDHGIKSQESCAKVVDHYFGKKNYGNVDKLKPKDAQDMFKDLSEKTDLLDWLKGVLQLHEKSGNREKETEKSEQQKKSSQAEPKKTSPKKALQVKFEKTYGVATGDMLEMIQYRFGSSKITEQQAAILLEEISDKKGFEKFQKEWFVSMAGEPEENGPDTVDEANFPPDEEEFYEEEEGKKASAGSLDLK